MILQALCGYYDRKEQQPEAALAPFGFEEKEIPFVIVLNEAGKFVLLADQREMHDGKLKSRVFWCQKQRGGLVRNHLRWPIAYGITMAMSWRSQSLKNRTVYPQSMI